MNRDLPHGLVHGRHIGCPSGTEPERFCRRVDRQEDHVGLRDAACCISREEEVWTAGNSRSQRPSSRRSCTSGIMAFGPVPTDPDYIDQARFVDGEMRRLPFLDPTGVAVHDVHGDVGVV